MSTHEQHSGGRELPPIDYPAIENSSEFRELKRRHRSFVFPIAIGFLVWYFAYVLLADYAHEFMSTPVFGNINLGLLLGLLQFISTFAITTWYVSYANRRIDPVATEIRAALERTEHSAATLPPQAMEPVSTQAEGLTSTNTTASASGLTAPEKDAR